MIEVEHLTKRYADLVAVDDVSFKVQKGEILGFLGPNGAGKTTTMRVLTCSLPPNHGTVRVAGYDVERESLEVRRRIGYLPEVLPLYPEMKVTAYLDFVAKIKEIPKTERGERVEAILKRCWIEEVADRLIRHLSKGYRQRVGLAQALLHNPSVVVLDEPTSGLDPKQIIETRQLIKSLAGDHTIILSTHILPEVAMTCQRVVIINQGRVVAEDTPENLTNRLLKGAERIVVQVRGPHTEVLEHAASLPGVLKVQEHAPGRPEHVTLELECRSDDQVRENIAAAIVGKGWGLLELRPVGLSLEDIFLKLTMEEAVETSDVGRRTSDEEGPVAEEEESRTPDEEGPVAEEGESRTPDAGRRTPAEGGPE